MTGRRTRGGGQRPERVGEQMRQILSEFLIGGEIKEPELQAADLVSITEVRVTSDLTQARVFTSVFPSDEEISGAVMAALIRSAPKIRSMLAQQMRIRHTPELQFSLDTSIETGARMEALIREVRADDQEQLVAAGDSNVPASVEGD